MTLSVDSVIAHPIALAFALLLTLLLEVPIRALLRFLESSNPVYTPTGVNEKDWVATTEVQRPVGGAWIGRLERVLFFATIISGAYAVLVAWLAFKVASKWEVWTNTYRIPDSLPGVTKIQFLRARVTWGSITYSRFLVGTASSLVAAFLGVALYYSLIHYVAGF